MLHTHRPDSRAVNTALGGRAAMSVCVGGGGGRGGEEGMSVMQSTLHWEDGQCVCVCGGGGGGHE